MSSRYGERAKRYTGRVREQPAPAVAAAAPLAAPVAAPAPPDQHAATRAYADVGQYSAAMQSRSAYGNVDIGPSPLAGLVPQQHPRSGPGGLINPFGTSPEEGGDPITQENWDTLVGQLGMTHRATPAARGKAFNQQYLASKVGNGAGGAALIPMSTLLHTDTKAADAIAIEHPESVDPAYLANMKANMPEIRRQVADWRTRNKGKMTLHSVHEFGDDLQQQFRNNSTSIQNILEDMISKDPPLAAENQRFETTGETVSMGNALWREQFDSVEQQRYQAMIEETKAGSISPELAKELGYKEEADGQFTYRTDGILNYATAQHVVERARQRWNIGGEAEPLPVQTGIAGMGRGSQGAIVMLRNGGEIVGRDAEEMIELQKRLGGEITEKNATDISRVLRGRGNPHDIQLAESLEKSFDILPEPIRDVPMPPAPDEQRGFVQELENLINTFKKGK